MEVARAAESSLKSAEIHLENLVTEGELSIQVLRDEIEEVRTRGQAARHQVAALRATLHSEGITPKLPPPLGGQNRAMYTAVGDHPSPRSVDDPLDTGYREGGLVGDQDNMQEELEARV